MTVAYRGNHAQYRAKVVDNEKNTHYPLLLHGTVNTNFVISVGIVKISNG